MHQGEVSQIGALSKATGVKVETIRWYEQVGLLPRPNRTEGNYRVYDDHHARRLHFIRRARDLGFPLDKVRELLALADQGERPCEEADVIAREHLDEVDRKIAELQEMRRELGAIIEGCCRRIVADCAVIGALRPGEPQ
ncbi:MAG: helix-turn-helix domain-containing protein [Roseomonas mucosa]|nr:helix-turn-helix domain-containing protein [Roseomonas mucosa]